MTAEEYLALERGGLRPGKRMEGRGIDAAQELAGSLGGAPDLLQDRRELIEVLLVRPGQGAWELTVGDGGPADEDGTGDGHLQASFSRMNPLASLAAPSAPAKLAAGDLLVVVDPETLEVSVTQLGAGH